MVRCQMNERTRKNKRNFDPSELCDLIALNLIVRPLLLCTRLPRPLETASQKQFWDSNIYWSFAKVCCFMDITVLGHYFMQRCPCISAIYHSARQ